MDVFRERIQTVIFELYPLTVATGIVLAGAITIYLFRRPLARTFGTTNRKAEQAEQDTKDAYQQGLEEGKE
jgi:hypothetical protein